MVKYSKYDTKYKKVKTEQFDKYIIGVGIRIEVTCCVKFDLAWYLAFRR